MFKASTVDYAANLKVIEFGSDARQAGIREAFRRFDSYSWSSAALATPIGVAVLSVALALAGVPVAFVLAGAALLMFAVMYWCTARASVLEVQRRTVLDDEVALTRLGLEASDGIGVFPVALLPSLGSDPAVEVLVREYQDRLALTPSQQQVADLLVEEGYLGSLRELAAAARSLG